MKSRIIGRVEEWWKPVCQKHNCKYYMHEDYPKCSYCTCPDNCIVVNKNATEVRKRQQMAKRLYVGVNWQYCKNLNDINKAIANHDKDWEGLNDANDIISITYDSNHSSFVVFWKLCTESEDR